MGWITDLLQELPLSAVQRERLALAEQKYSLLETSNTDLKSKYAILESETEALKLENVKLQQEIQRRDDVIQKEKSHGSRLEEVREKIIVFLVSNDGATDQQIAQHIEIGEQVASFHLQELEAARFARRTLRVGQRTTPWHVTQESRRYLVTHGLIS